MCEKNSETFFILSFLTLNFLIRTPYYRTHLFLESRLSRLKAKPFTFYKSTISNLNSIIRFFFKNFF